MKTVQLFCHFVCRVLYTYVYYNAEDSCKPYVVSIECWSSNYVRFLLFNLKTTQHILFLCCVPYRVKL